MDRMKAILFSLRMVLGEEQTGKNRPRLVGALWWAVTNAKVAAESDGDDSEEHF